MSVSGEVLQPHDCRYPLASDCCCGGWGVNKRGFIGWGLGNLGFGFGFDLTSCFIGSGRASVVDMEDGREGWRRENIERRELQGSRID